MSSEKQDRFVCLFVCLYYFWNWPVYNHPLKYLDRYSWSETSRQVCAGGFGLPWINVLPCLWLSLTTHHSQSHTLVVKRLRWRPRPGRAGHGEQERNEEQAWVQLASAGADHVVKIFNIKISALWRALWVIFSVQLKNAVMNYTRLICCEVVSGPEWGMMLGAVYSFP